ncbi:uncharacterized protein LOC143461952 [Clavelina lepadiformis]|uniref:uncharacterized protein LOC143461952 n=1 Tax=Clavelina lepadiformis TaxID=159417 RepID=UPI00404300BB
MDTQLGDTGITLGDVSDATKTADDLANTARQLPGMTSPNDQGSAEPEICPTCNQKIITNQPTGAEGDTFDQVLEKSESILDCCSKAFDCLKKATDAVGQIQELTGE